MKTQREYRKEIAEVCRWMYEKSYITSTDGNVSVRYAKDRILITPSGIHKGFVKFDELIVLDLAGNKLSGSKNASLETPMHLEAYRSRADVHAVVHAHPVHCIAFTLAGMHLGKDYLPEVILSVGEIPIVPYTTPTTDEIPQQIKAFLPKHNAMILDRHGALTVGKTLLEAFCHLERMEHVAHTMYVARQMGPLRHLTDEQLQKLKEL